MSGRATYSARATSYTSLRFIAIAVITTVWLLVVPPVCPALTLSIDEVDCYETASFGLAAASTDPTGTVVLTVDGRTMGTEMLSAGESLRFEDLDISPGSHDAVAILRGRDGVAVSEVIPFDVWTDPSPTRLVSPVSYAAQYTYTSVLVGDQTTSLSMYVNGTLVHTREVIPFALGSMTRIALQQGVNTIELVGSNPCASTRSTFQVRRLDYPWPTCIIIDKSDYRLYWIRDGVLVKAYPVAIGKSYTPTPEAIWRIDAKYYTDPSGVYGPRKMRLFRRTSSGYTYTAYGIHGTNQPWVIGTMASHGCIRMYNSDVLELFPQVPLGTMVQTRQ